MRSIVLIAAPLLLIALSEVAAAADIPTTNFTSRTTVDAPLTLEEPQSRDPQKDRSKKAKKMMILLGAMGINSSEVQSFVSAIDARVEDGYFRLAEQKLPGGKITLQYQLESKADVYSYRSKRQIELRFTPDNSHFQAYARPDRVVIEYRFKF